MSTKMRRPSTRISLSAFASTSRTSPSVRLRFNSLCPSITDSHAAERAESTVHRKHYPVDEARARAAQPDKGPHEIVRLTKPPHRGMGDDCSRPCGRSAIPLQNQVAILGADEQAWRDRLHPHRPDIAASELTAQPTGP